MVSRTPAIVTAAAVAICSALAWQARTQQPDLRARIDRLIAEAHTTPTNKSNGKERAILVDEWANYLSHQGIVIPQLLLTNVATFKLGIFPMPIDPYQTLDWNIEELALKEKHPHGLGRIQVRNLDGGPLVVNTYTPLEFVYTVGEVPIHPGGGLRMGKYFGASHGVPQAMDRTKANYVSFHCSNPLVKLRVGTSKIYGVNGGFRGVGEFPAVYVEQGTLGRGDTLTVILGDRRWGGPGFRTQLVTNDRFIVPIFVDFSGNGNFMLMDNPPMKVIGGPPARRPTASGVAPSRTPAEVDTRGKVEIIKDVEYATGPEYGDNRGKLDLYLPKGRRKLPFLIIFHGGGLTKGDKASDEAYRRAVRDGRIRRGGSELPPGAGVAVSGLHRGRGDQGTEGPYAQHDRA